MTSTASSQPRRAVQSAPLSVCAGASVGRAGPALAGIAWAATNGTFAYNVVSTRSTLVAELTALKAVTDAHKHIRGLIVLSHHEYAIRVVNEGRRSDVALRTGNTALRQALHLLQALAATRRHQHVDFRWIKGDADHLLSVTTNRLALQARRCAQNGGHLSGLMPLADRIVNELLAA